MTQIVVTLEDGSNTSLIRNTIKMIKGVKHTLVKKSDEGARSNAISARLEAFDRLSGVISLSDIDLDDDRTKYLLEK